MIERFVVAVMAAFAALFGWIAFQDRAIAIERGTAEHFIRSCAKTGGTASYDGRQYQCIRSAQPAEGPLT